MNNNFIYTKPGTLFKIIEQFGLMTLYRKPDFDYHKSTHYDISYGTPIIFIGLYAEYGMDAGLFYFPKQTGFQWLLKKEVEEICQ